MTEVPMSPEADKQASPATAPEKRSRPVPLSIIGALGIALGVLAAAFHIFGIFMEPNDRTYKFLAAADVLAVVAFIGLWIGRLWGWILVQVFFALFLAQCAVLIVKGKDSGGGAVGVFLVMSLPVILSWLYIYTRRARSYCRVSKG